jgi:hypothetical protein
MQRLNNSKLHVVDEWSANLPLPDYGRVARHLGTIAMTANHISGCGLHGKRELAIEVQRSQPSSNFKLRRRRAPVDVQFRNVISQERPQHLQNPQIWGALTY